jgi:hypothetical protein
MAWVRVTGMTTCWRCGARGGAQRPPGPGSNELISLADEDPVGVEGIDGARQAVWCPAEDGASNHGLGMAAAAAIDVEKTSLSCLLNKLVILERQQLATAGTAAGLCRSHAGHPWVCSPAPPMIANGKV